MGCDGKLFTDLTHRLILQFNTALAWVLVMVMRMSTCASSVGATFWNERLMRFFYRSTQPSDELCQHLIWLDQGSIGQQHRPHVAVCQVIHNTHQFKGIIGTDQHQRLSGCLYQDTLTCFTGKSITVLHGFTTRQHHGHGTSIGQHGSQAGTLPILKGQLKDRQGLTKRV
jgi:hypothetical protein